jgi:WD40 repeat protein
LVECSITSMQTINSYLVIAGSDGAVRFYDFSLRLEAWFEDFMAGPVTSLSFSAMNCPFPEGMGGEPGTTFWVPDFMIGTSEALIVGVESAVYDEVSPDDRRGTLLVQGMAENVSDVCCHPHKTLVALSSYNGTLQVWDYDMKLLMNLREFNTKAKPQMTALGAKKPKDVPFLRPQCITFDPSGMFLAVAFTTGDVKFLYSDSFEDAASYFFPDPLISLKFSPSGEYLAGYDAANHVVLLKRNTITAAPIDDQDEENEEDSTIVVNKDAYIFIGRILSHSSIISGIDFGVKESGETLVSVGEDRRCVEYDLHSSSVKDGIRIVEQGRIRVELTAQPTAVSWHPHIGDDVEDRFIVVNDEFKFKEFNSDSKQCRKTTLAPTFGGPPNKLMIQKGDDEKYYFVYSTTERIVGIGSLPLTGCPTQVMGLVAHPGKIAATCLSNDGKFLFTAGGADLTIGMWAVNFNALPPLPSADDNGKDISSFLDMLDGGNGGDLHNDIIDYFYLCQLRTQGEDAMGDRAIKGLIHVDEISALSRAIGFYPTEEEIENMCNEIRYKNFMITGEAQDELSIEEFIKLYVNHRPVNPLNSNEIDNAFEVIEEK